jgi:DNA-3-methyladenine glycosylase II
MHTSKHQLAAVPPFDFAKSLAFVGEFPATQGEQNLASQTMTKALRVNGQTVVFVLHATWTEDKPQLDVTIHSAKKLSNADEAAVLDRIRFFLSLDDDLSPFYAIAEDDKLFRDSALKTLYGYHQVKFLTPFENAAWAVLTQRTPIPVAQKIKQAIIAEYTEALEVDGISYTAFPEPADFLALDAGRLNELIGNERKASYLSAVIDAFADVDENFLRTGDYDEVKTWLTNIKGIGDWSAAFVMIRGLGRMESMQVDDEDSLFTKEMMRAAKKVYGDLSFEQFQQKAKHYGEWQGYWAHYLRASGGD